MGSRLQVSRRSSSVDAPLPRLNRPGERRLRPKGLTCRELVELVTDYLEGALSRRDRSRFEAHLAGCANCTSYVEQLRKTIRLTGMLRESDVPAEAADALLAAFAAWKRDRA